MAILDEVAFSEEDIDTVEDPVVKLELKLVLERNDVLHDDEDVEVLGVQTENIGALELALELAEVDWVVDGVVN